MTWPAATGDPVGYWVHSIAQNGGHWDGVSFTEEIELPCLAPAYESTTQWAWVTAYRVNPGAEIEVMAQPMASNSVVCLPEPNGLLAGLLWVGICAARRSRRRAGRAPSARRVRARDGRSRLS